MDWILLNKAFFIIVLIGVMYSLWRTTKAYGGLIGVGLKWIGLGIIFFSLEALDRVLGNFGFLSSFRNFNPDVVHNVFLILGLLFSGIGFSQLMKFSK